MGSHDNSSGERPNGLAGRFALGWRHKRFFAVTLLVALAVAANHMEYHFRTRQIERNASGGAVVRSEHNLFAGHSTIGIDEKASAGSDLLRFSTLGQWDYDPQASTPCPASIQGFNSREVSCLGFMYPLETAAMLKSFCLLRTTQTCCFGPRPQFNQYMLVEMARPVKFERLAPVMVKGRFFVDAQPTQGYIYRMEGISVAPVAGEEPDENPADAARRAGLPLLDLSPLALVKERQASDCPPETLALDGKRVVLAGFFVDRGDQPPRILIGRAYWDGVSQGERPNIYNAVMVYLKDGALMPPLWKQKGIVTGVLHVERNREAWPKSGIMCLREAVCGAPGDASYARADSSPVVNLWQEIVAATLTLCAALVRVKRVPPQANN